MTDLEDIGNFVYIGGRCKQAGNFNSLKQLLYNARCRGVWLCTFSHIMLCYMKRLLDNVHYYVYVSVNGGNVNYCRSSRR